MTVIYNQGTSTLQFHSIIGRLKELGYTDDDFLDDDDDSNWKWEQLIDQPRDLTDKSEFHHSKPISMFA